MVKPPARWGSVVTAVGLVALIAAALAVPASGHNSGCHSHHTCPSDHHTYVWYDSSGHGLDCAEPGAPELGPSDTVKVVYDGLTWYCHYVGSVAPTATATFTPTPTPAYAIPTATATVAVTATPTTAPKPLPRLSVAATRYYLGIAFKRKFKALWVHGGGKRIRSCSRKSRIRVQCRRVSWFAGDLIFYGKGTIWLTRKHGKPYWNYAYTIRRLDDYCASVLHRQHCVKVFKVK